jgi:hypothetical protein
MPLTLRRAALENVGDPAPSGSAGRPPRLFALVQEDEDENNRVIWEVMAYGMVLPNGSAATVGSAGTGFGSWRSPESASRHTYSELVWFSR